MTDELIEAVARAICAANGDDPHKSAGNMPFWAFYQDDARAALAVAIPAVLEMNAQEALAWAPYTEPPSDSDGNPEGEDGTASSQSDDSAGPEAIAKEVS